VTGGAVAAIRIGTRGSALALAQAWLVAAALRAAGRESELVVVQTEGDRRAPDTAWGEGAFVGAIEQALLDGRIDVGVHSAKDLPTDEDPRLKIVAFLPRAEPRDALVVAAGTAPATIDLLPAGATVGTDSPRRTGFLRARRPDLDVRPLHGNVDTRLGRLDAGEVDALLVAAAGLLRLGRGERIGQLVPADVIPPAAGQGALAVQVRADDEGLAELGRLIDDPPTRVAVETERAFLAATGGGCRAPIGALATVEGAELRLVAGFAALDGRFASTEELLGSVADAPALAADLANRLVARRAQLPGAPRVLLTRPAESSRRLAARLAEQGLGSVIVPAIEIELLDSTPELLHEVGRLAEYRWAVVTSANGALALAGAARRLGTDLAAGHWAAVGRGTARALAAAGAPNVWLPSRSSGAALGEQLPIEPGAAVLVVRGELAEAALPTALRRRGATVRELTVYRTLEAPPASHQLLEAALATGELSAVIFASPSAVRGTLALAAAGRQADLLRVPAICIGPTTAAAAREAGFTVAAEAAAQDSDALAELVAEAILRQPTGANA
jgi:hydroxymethylbilane synthase